MKDSVWYVHSLPTLTGILDDMPDGTTADILAEDLEAGNFDQANFQVSGVDHQLQINYTGPVREGYVSSFTLE